MVARHAGLWREEESNLVLLRRVAQHDKKTLGRGSSHPTVGVREGTSHPHLTPDPNMFLPKWKHRAGFPMLQQKSILRLSGSEVEGAKEGGNTSLEKRPIVHLIWFERAPSNC